MWRKRILILFPALLLVLPIPVSAATSEPARPANILLITFDSLSARYLPFHGFPEPTAPHLQAFAGECVVFTGAVSQSGSTSFSLGSLFTSRYPFIDNLIVRKLEVRKNKLFLPVLLRSNGYHTYAIVRNTYAAAKLGFDHGFDHFDDEFSTAFAEETFRTASELVETRLKEPFFLWIHVEEPHSPYLPPERYFREFFKDRSLPTVYDLIKPSSSKPYEIFEEGYDDLHRALSKASKQVDEYRVYNQKLKMGDEEIRQLKARYLGSIRYADEHFGKFLRSIRDREFFPRTLVVVTADHGESTGEHNLFGHNELFQEIIHVPLLVHLPGQQQGKVVDDPVELVDIYPTILRMAKVSPGHEIRGEDLFSSPRGKTTRFAEQMRRKWVARVLIRNGTKYWCENEAVGSYDLVKDPGERSIVPVDNASDPPCDFPSLPGDIFAVSSDAQGKEDGLLGTGPRRNPLSRETRPLRSGELDTFVLMEAFLAENRTAYHYGKGKERLKIDAHENIAETSARSKVEKEILQLKAMFSPSFSPYPEELSNEVQCAERFNPVFREQTSTEGIRVHALLYSNERFSSGVCQEDLVAYRYLIGWIYCPGARSLFTVRYFVPRGGSDDALHDLFSSLACK